jgi:citrate synthase
MSFDDLAKRMAASQGAPLPPPGELPTPAQLARANQRASAHREITSGAILLVAGLASRSSPMAACHRAAGRTSLRTGR